MKRFSYLLIIFLLFILTSCTGQNATSSKSTISKTPPKDDSNISATIPNDDGWLTNEEDLENKPIFDVIESYIDFGTVYIGAKPRIFSTRYINLRNLGGMPFDYTTSTLMNDFYFDMDNTTCGLNGGRLEAGSSCIYAIVFLPVSKSEPTGRVMIRSGGTGKDILLHGRGEIILRSSINANYNEIFFPTTIVGESSSIELVIKNTGSELLKFDADYPNKEAFSRTGGTCDTNFGLKPDSTCTMIITFTPKIVATFRNELILNNRNDTLQRMIIPLNGKAIKNGFFAFSDKELFFGLVKVGESVDRNFMITNAGNLTLKFKTTFPEGFYDNGSTCNVNTYATLKSGESCMIRIRFAPTKEIVYTDYIRFISNQGLRAEVNMVAGGYVNEPLRITPKNINFGTILLGTKSGIRSILVENNALLPMRFDISIPNGFEFIPESSCAKDNMTLQPSERCLINLKFTPSTRMTYNGDVTIKYLNIIGGVVANLTGIGTTIGEITTTPTAINFGNIETGTLSTMRLVVRNSGGLPLLFTSQIEAPFTLLASSTCGTFNQQLTADEECFFDIGFTPINLITYNSNLAMTYNGKIHNVALTGIGATPPSITVDKTALTFADTFVTEQSAPQEVIITSNGGADAVVTINMPEGFLNRGTCATITRLPNGSNCSINVIFAPIRNVRYNSSISISIPGMTRNVTVTGTGITLGEVTANPTSYNYGRVLIGATTPTTFQFTLTNTGDRDVTFTTTLPDGFIHDTAVVGCSLVNQVLAKNASCILSVTFNPSRNERYNADIILTYLIGAGNRINVSGIGTLAGNLEITPALLNFNNVELNRTVSLTARYTNTGENPILFNTNENFRRPFTRNALSTCALMAQQLLPSQSCIIVMDFSPTAPAISTGSISSTYDNLVGATVTKTLTLHGTGVLAGELTINPGPVIRFPDTAVGKTSIGTTITVTNNSAAVLNINAIFSSDFNITSTSACTLPDFSLTAGTSCTFSIVFKPTTVGIIQGFASFRYGAKSADLILSGTSLAPPISMTPMTLNFADQRVGTESLQKTVVIANNGTDDILYTIILPDGIIYNDKLPGCALTGDILPAGATCDLSVIFKPTEMKSYTGQISFLNNAPPARIEAFTTITARGVDKGRIKFNSSSVNFGDVAIVSPPTILRSSIKIENSGGSTATFYPTEPNAFTLDKNLTSDCFAKHDTLAPKESCTYIIAFSPSTTADYSTTMQFLMDGETYSLRLVGGGRVGRKLDVSTDNISFLDTSINYLKTRSVTVSNVTNTPVNYNIFMPIDFDMDNSSTCKKSSTLDPHDMCDLVINFKPDDIASYEDYININADNSSVKIKLTAVSRQNGYVKHLANNIDMDNNLSFSADNDTLFIYNNTMGRIYKYDMKNNLYSLVKLINPISDNAKVIAKDNFLYIFFGDSFLFYRYSIAEDIITELKYSAIKKPIFDNSTELSKQGKNIYLINRDNATNNLRFDESELKFIQTLFDRRTLSTADTKNYLSKIIEIKKTKSDHKIITDKQKVFMIKRFDRNIKDKFLTKIDTVNNKIDNVTIDDKLSIISTNNSEPIYYDGAIFLIDDGNLSMIMQ